MTALTTSPRFTPAPGMASFTVATIVSPMRPSDLTTLTGHDPALHRQLVDRATQCLAGGLLVREAHLEHHPAGLDVGDPLLRRALAGTHAGLGGLLGERAVREHVDPDLAATTDVPGDGDTRRL